MSDDRSENRLTVATKFMRSLTPQGVALALILCAGSLVLYAMYESRAEWSALLWKSPWAIAMVFGAAVALWAGTSMASLHRRIQHQLEEAQDRIQAHSDERIAGLHRDIQACHDEREELRKEVSELYVELRSTHIQLNSFKDELRSLRDRPRHTDN